MKRLILNTLILNDNYLECIEVQKQKTLTDLNLTHFSFSQSDYEKFELIVYEGSRGTKILKSESFKKGKIK